jgi:hypothetical protein
MARCGEEREREDRIKDRKTNPPPVPARAAPTSSDPPLVRPAGTEGFTPFEPLPEFWAKRELEPDSGVT